MSFFIAALLTAAGDQISKLWIRSSLAPGESLFEVGIFRIIRVHNTGASFGLFQGYNTALIVIGILGIVVILAYALYFHRRFPILNNLASRIALGMVLGGTIGNLIDRLTMGHVIDFIGVGWWPTFNIADSSVIIGIIIIAYCLLRFAQTQQHEHGTSN